MTNVTVTIPPGVVKPGTDSLAAGRWWDANLVRWPGTVMQPVGGWERITSAPLASTVRLIRSWRDLDDIRRTVLMADGHIYTHEGGAFADRTPAGFNADNTMITTEGGYGTGPYSDSTYGTPRVNVDLRLFFRPSTWSADAFGEVMLCVASSDGRLWQLDPGAVTATGMAGHPRDLAPTATVVAAAPVNNRSVVVTEERHVMLFGAAGNGRRVAWSSREDYNDWDFSNTTNTAGFFDLDISGWIVNAVKVRGGVLIFTDDEVWLCRYRGLPFVYGFERIGSSCGIVAPHAFATTAGIAMWMGRQGFWSYNGGTVQAMPCDILDYIYDNLDPTAGPIRTHASANGLFSEAWFCWPSRGATDCNSVAIFSYETGNRWWSKAEVARTALDASGVYPFPLGASPTRDVFQHENGWLSAGQSRAGIVYAETGAISIPTNSERRTHVVQAMMDSRPSTARTDVTAFVRETHNGPEEVYGPYAPRSDGWTDMRFSGRDARLRFVQAGEGDWTLGQMHFDVRQGSKR